MNEILKIDDSTKSMYGLPDPMINAIFINDDGLFVNLLHRGSMNHYHFLYDYKKQVMVD